MAIQESHTESNTEPTDTSTNTPGTQTARSSFTRRAITREKIISELQAAALELGHAPTTTEFARLSGIHNRSAKRYFPTYLEAVRAAGLEPNPTGQRLNSAAILEDWGEVVRKLGFVPTRREYLREGKYGYVVFRNRFQKWSLVPPAFYRFATTGKLQGAWEDVLEKIRLGPIPGTGFGKHLQRWREEAKQIAALGDSPAQGPEENSGEADNKIETPQVLPPLPPLWRKQRVTAAMMAVLFAGTTPLSALFPRRTFSDRPLLGAPMDIPGLAHEPLNEMGVILLFGLVARELGFIVESVRAAFPDCEAKMEVEPGKWQRVRIEFEYESVAFKDHKHDPQKCDLIVCWRHNWKACPANLQVLELSKLLRQGS